MPTGNNKGGGKAPRTFSITKAELDQSGDITIMLTKERGGSPATVKVKMPATREDFIAPAGLKELAATAVAENQVIPVDDVIEVLKSRGRLLSNRWLEPIDVGKMNTSKIDVVYVHQQIAKQKHWTLVQLSRVRREINNEFSQLKNCWNHIVSLHLRLRGRESR